MKKLALPLVLLGLVLMILLSIFTAGDTHVTVVGENETLTVSNTKLTSQNSQLKTLNNNLSAQNKQLVTQVTTLSETVNSLNEESEGIIVKTIVKIEKEIDDNRGWCSPEEAYDVLASKLIEKPTAEEFEQTLVDLCNRQLLNHPGEPDPNMMGKSVSRSEIKKLVKKYIK
jgi:hypothetical protein